MALDSDKYIFYYDSDYIQEGYYEQELYFEGDYLVAGYFEGEQVVQEAAADLVATAALTTEITVFVPASADLQSTATQTATVGKIIEAAAEFEALFTPSITIQAIRFTDALFEIIASIETAANLIADIDSVLENIVNLSLQGDRAAGLSSLLPASADLTAEPNVIKDTTAQLESNTNLSITFIVEFESVIASEFSVLARNIVYQSKPLTRDTVFVDNTSNGNATISIVNDNKFGGGSANKEFAVDEQTIGTPVWDGTEYKIFGAGHTLTSTDGYTWTKTSNNLTITALKPKFIDNEYVYGDIGFNSAEFYTSSDGTNWQETVVTLNELAGTFIASQEAFKAGGFWWLVTRSTDRFRIYKNTSISTTGWQEETQLGGFDDLGFGTSSISNGNLYIPLTDFQDNFPDDYRVIVIDNQGNYDLKVVNAPGTDLAFRQILELSDNRWIAVFSEGATYKYYSYNSDPSDSPSLYRETSDYRIFDVVNDTFFYYSVFVNNTETGATENAVARQDLFSENQKVVFQNQKYWTHDDDLNLVYTSNDAVNWDTVYIGEVASHLEYSNTQLSDWKAIDFHFKWDNEGFNPVIPLFSFGNLQVAIRKRSGVYNVREITPATSLSLSEGIWYNARIQQDSSNQYKFYINGNIVGTVNKNIISGNTIKIHAFTAPSGFGGMENVLIDEFVVSKEHLHPYSNNSYSVPTQEFANSEDLALLLHFNDDFEDDALLDVIVEAELTSNTTTVIDVTAIIDSESVLGSTSSFDADVNVITQLEADLDSSAAQTATGTRLLPLDSTLETTAALAADANIIQTVDAALAAQATLAAQPTRILQLEAEFESLFTPDVTVNAIRFVDALFELITDLDVVSQKRTGVFGNFDSSTLLQADINRTRSTTSTLSAQFDIDISEDILRLASATLQSSFDIELNTEIQRQANAVLETVSELEAALDGEVDFAADLVSQTQLAAAGTGNFNANALLDAQAAVTAAINVQFTLEQTLGTASSLQANLTEFAVREEQIYTIRPEQRTFVIEAENRVYTIRPENRTWSIT